MAAVKAPKKDNRTFMYGVRWPNVPFGRGGQAVPTPEWYVELQILRFYDELKAKGVKVQEWAHHFIRFTKIVFGDPQGIFYFEWNPNAKRILVNFCKHNILAIAGSASSGKCLAPHTKVRMFDGSAKRADEVMEGDLLAGDNLDARTVLSTCSGKSNMVRIVPVSGDPWEDRKSTRLNSSH